MRFVMQNKSRMCVCERQREANRQSCRVRGRRTHGQRGKAAGPRCPPRGCLRRGDRAPSPTAAPRASGPHRSRLRLWPCRAGAGMGCLLTPGLLVSVWNRRSFCGQTDSSLGTAREPLWRHHLLRESKWVSVLVNSLSQGSGWLQVGTVGERPGPAGAPGLGPGQ